MRETSKITLIVAASLLTIGVGTAQLLGTERQPPFGGGAFATGNEPYQLLKVGTGDPYILTKNKKVQTEINLTDVQLKELANGMERVVANVISDKQAKRFGEIVLQQKGVMAFKDPTVLGQLALTQAQKDNIATLFADYEKEVDKAGGGKGFAGTAALKKELTERVNAVLNAQQKTAYDGLLGAKFTISVAAGGVAKAVHAEIRFTENQLQQLDKEAAKVIEKLLSDKQAHRLGQIALQQKGVNAFKEAKVQDQLKLTDIQKASITVLFHEYDKTYAAAAKDKGGFKTLLELRKQLTDNVNAVLSAEQRTMYDAMLGQKFSLFGSKAP